MNHWEKQIKSIAYKIKQTLAAMLAGGNKKRKRSRLLSFSLVYEDNFKKSSVFLVFYLQQRSVGIISNNVHLIHFCKLFFKKLRCFEHVMIDEGKLSLHGQFYPHVD